MKVIFIPDIHNKYQVAEDILSSESYDFAVFSGDEFDSWGDNADINRETAVWLKESLKKPDRIHLLANHTLPYFAPFDELFCSGYRPEKMFAIREVMKIEDFNKYKIIHEIDGIIFSHASVNRNWFLKRYGHIISYPIDNKEVMYVLEEEAKTCKEALNSPIFRDHPFFDVDYFSGGREQYAGPFWARTNNVSLLDGFGQIFGHTPQQSKFNHKILYPSFFYKRENGVVHVDSCNEVRHIKELTKRMNAKTVIPKGSSFGIAADTHLTSYLVIEFFSDRYEITVKPSKISPIFGKIA